MRLKHFISVFLALLFLGVGQVWAEDGTLVITRSCFPSGSLAYNVTDAWSATASTSETVSGQGDLYSTATQTTMQTKNSGVSTHYHNTTALPGALKSIEVSVASGTDRTYTVYASASAAITSTTGLTSIGTVNGSTSLTGIDTSKGYKYFWMQCGGGASFLSSITITYEVSGDDPTPAVTSDPASWDFGAVATDAAASKVFSISGSDLEAGTLTLTAPSGYSVSPASITVASAGDLDATNVTVSKNTTTAGSYNDNLTISGCGLEDDVEVALSMEVKAKYTVTWNNNGSTSTSEVLDGEKPIFPATPAACDATSTTFIGWATAPWDGKIANLTGKTVYTSADAMPAVSGAVTYYAVFAKSSGSAADLFSWAGGSSSDLATAAGATQNVGSDYASGNAPYLVKLDGTGKYILIAIASQPGKVALDVKMIGGANTSSITVQEADETDGEFTDVETLSISGAQNDVLNLETSNSFKSTTRAIKLYFTKGSNVGVGPITIEGAVAYADYMTTCCTKYNVNIAAGITNGTVSADLAQACEGTTVTLTFTPAGSYHLESWSVNGTEQDVAENTFTMPGEAVTVSATFAHDACENLAAPTLNGEIVKTYNSATIAWNTVTGAQAYVVSVVNHETSEVVFSSDDYDELSKALTGLEPETQYDYSIMAVGDGVEKCAEGNPALAGNFTTNALPTAHLTLMNLGAEHASSGDYAILTPFNLPTTAATCSKAFVGWDADADCAVAPTYAPGAEFTFANTTGVTLYAVYADVAAGPTTNIAYLNTETTTNMTGGNDAALLGLNAEEWSVVGAKGGNSNYPGLNKAKDIRLYYQSEDVGNTITITAPQTIASVALTFTADDYSNAWVKVGGEAVTLSDGVYPINANTFVIGNANTSNVQVRISNIAVNFPGTQSNWATTCLDAPVATPDPASIEAAAAGTSGTITMTYDNVNTSELAVALYSNAACTEAFTGSWLTASINGDKNIAYTIAENTSYNDARTAYIKLTAPETTGATAPAVVVIPVSQAKKAAVFSSLEELVAADVNANTNVTVSFSNVVIKDIYYYNSNRRGLIFDIQKADEDIKIYYNADVPAEWVAGGKVSGTLTDCPWKIYSGAWQLAPASGFVWATDLSYTAPAEVSTVVVSGSPSKTTYVDGEKLNPAGLSVRVNYTDETYEDNPVGVTFSEVVLHEGDTEAEITATYGTTTSDAYTVTGLTVGAIPNKTIAEFIAAEGTRCYLEGIVSNITNTTYGNFDLTDASGSIYVYGCLTSEGESAKFNTLGVSAGDKIKVIAEDYEFYNSKHEAKNVQFVSKTSPVEITITSASTVEKGKTLTLTATTDPAAGAEHITYSIKVDGNEGNVSLSGAVLTGVEIGEATIIASIPDGEGYIANTKEFTVTVIPAVVHGSITYEENGGSEVPDVADATNLPDPLPVPTKEHNNFAGWWTTSTFEAGSEAVAGDALTGDITLYAKWTPLPEQAYTYTSNVELSAEGGTQASAAIVKFFGGTPEFNALKAGTSGTAGVLKVTVPAQTEKLHFHAYGWSGENVKLNITAPTGVTVTPVGLSELPISINANTGINTGSPFTLSETADPEHDAYYAVSLSGNDDEVELTISATSGKRFVLFGINQEGGVVPVLDHIVITGTATETEYEVGDVFVPAGLGVDAYYTLAGTPIAEPTHLVVDENWSGWSVAPAVLTGETTSVTVTATYEGKTDSKAVDVTVTAPVIPEIVVNKNAIAFGTVNQNAVVSAEGISVTLKSVAAATVAIDGDVDAFSIDKAALSELSSTITVTPVTTAVGTFAATITISDDANVAEDKEIELSMTVEAVEDLSGTWVVASSVAAGDRIIIGATYNNATKTMGVQNTKNRAAVASTLDAGVLTPAEGTKTFTLVDAGDSKFALQALNGKYLSSTSDNSNDLVEVENYEDNKAKWTIEIDGEGVASVVAAAGTKTDLRYNNSSNIFSCYGGTQNAINIYVPYVAPTKYTVTVDALIQNGTVVSDKDEAEEGETVTLTITPNAGFVLSELWVNTDNVTTSVVAGSYEFTMPAENVDIAAAFTSTTPPTPDYSRAVEVNRYGTICLPNGGNISGAKLYDLEYYDNANTLYLLEVEGNAMVAGRPYIFLPSVGTIEVFYTDEANADAGSHNGLIGWLGNENQLITPNAGNYILSNNQYWFVNSAAYVTPNHAYIHMEDVPKEPSTSAPGAAPRRRVAMAVNGENAATGFENIESGDAPMKVMIEGTMYILRGEKVYDATGRLVK